MKRNSRQTKNRIQLSYLFPVLTITGIGILLLFASSYEPKWLYNWSGIRKEIKDSILLVERDGISSGVRGNGYSSADEVERRKIVMNAATIAELTRLLEYPNGSVRATAYEGLLQKDDFSQKTELIMRAISDTAFLIYYHSGCFVWQREIGEYLVQDVLMIDDEMPPLHENSAKRIHLAQADIDRILVAYRKRPKNNQ